MADPKIAVDVAEGIGKASQHMVKELQKQMQQVSETGPKFGEVLSQNQPSTITTQNLDPTKVASTDVLKAAASNPVGQATDAARLGVKPIEQKSGVQPGLKNLLNQVVEGQNKLDHIIKMATSGKQYGNQELLAIQAAVYKFSQELELTSKVVEKATSGVKQTMQTQV